MAIPISWWCDYEVTLTGGEGGIYGGVARSLQAAGGHAPGLAGHRPTVRVQGDTVRFMADPAERPRAAWTLFFVFWWPALANRWYDRNANSAPVRAFELTAHGLHEALAPKCVLRVQHQRRGGPGVEAVNGSRVTVLDVGKSCRADGFATQAW